MSLPLLPRISQPDRLPASKLSHLRATRVRSSVPYYSTRPQNPSPQSTPNTHPSNPSLPSFNLFREIQSARPVVRCTIYAGLGLMATVESTFWFNVVRAKFFPANSDAEKAKADEFMENLGEAVAGARKAWMGNYRRYYGGYVWGVGER